MQTAAPVAFPVASGRVDALAALSSVGFSDPQPASAPVNGVGALHLVQTNGDWNYTPLEASAPQPGKVLLRGQGSWTGSARSASAPSSGSAATAGCQLHDCRHDGEVHGAVGRRRLTFKLAISVKNDLGTTTMLSALSQPVGAASPAPSAPPASTSPPVISGSAVDGQTLAASAGAWTNSPTGYAYQWKRCNATGASYALDLCGHGELVQPRVRRRRLHHPRPGHGHERRRLGRVDVCTDGRRGCRPADAPGDGWRPEPRLHWHAHEEHRLAVIPGHDRCGEKLARRSPSRSRPR